MENVENPLPEESKECAVCCEEYKAKNPKVVCHCKYECCITCIKKFIQNSEDICCMSCKSLWSIEFINANFSKTFMKDFYLKTKLGIYLIREESLLPRTYDFTRKKISSDVYYGQSNTVYVPKIHCIENDCNGYMEEKGEGMSCIIRKESLPKIALKQQEKLRLEKKLKKLRAKTYIDLKCLTCDCIACGCCGQKKAENHECDYNNILNMELIRKDTKNCPKCSRLIHRTEGCPQMFCTVCHVGFHWDTLEIITTGIHNPHYFQWLNSNRNNGNNNEGGNIGGNREGNNNNRILNRFNNNCGMLDIIDDGEIYNDVNRLIKMYNINSNITNCMNGLRTMALEIRDRIQFLNHTRNYVQYNHNIRCRYVWDEITKKRFNVLINTASKKYEYNRKVFDLIATMIVVFNEDMNGILQYIHDIEKKVSINDDSRVHLWLYIKNIQDAENNAQIPISRKVYDSLSEKVSKRLRIMLNNLYKVVMSINEEINTYRVMFGYKVIKKYPIEDYVRGNNPCVLIGYKHSMNACIFLCKCKCCSRFNIGHLDTKHMVCNTCYKADDYCKVRGMHYICYKKNLPGKGWCVKHDKACTFIKKDGKRCFKGINDELKKEGSKFCSTHDPDKKKRQEERDRKLKESIEERKRKNEAKLVQVIVETEGLRNEVINMMEQLHLEDGW